jgi:predicted ester cyclase
MQIELDESLAAGDKLVRRVSWTATHSGTFLGIPATGRSVAVREMIILRMTGGKIAEEWETADLLGLLQQLGAVPCFELDPVPSA